MAVVVMVVVKAGENENMDPDGRALASRVSFLWFDPSLREKLRSRTPSHYGCALSGHHLLYLELCVLIGFESVHCRILYAGRWMMHGPIDRI